MTEEDETAVVICQAIDSDYVYFYEDICWHMGEYTEDDLATLKEQNDWEEELDFDKMSKRKNKVTFDGFLLTTHELEYKPLKVACCKELNIQEEQITGMPTLDKNDKGYELCLLMFHSLHLFLKKYTIILRLQIHTPFINHSIIQKHLISSGRFVAHVDG